jgi:NitT/TauT family transport system ATP-binding protein
LLDIRHLHKTYEGAGSPAVSDFNLTVETGEFVSLIGPTGCGKTTVLRMVVGLLPPSGGQVLLDGQPSLAPSREKAIVFQLFNLFPWRTALGNVAYGLEVQGMPKKERLARANAYLKRVGLDHRATHYPHQMSGGENQRVGIARALVLEPKMLLMDEPFGSLDALTREQQQVMLQHICEASNLTVLLVTHSIDEAVFLSDRIIVMGVNGQVIRELSVGLPRPRDEQDWREASEYGELRSEIWGLLREEIGHRAMVDA